MSVGWREMSHMEDFSVMDTPKHSQVNEQIPTNLEQTFERLRPVQQSPLTLNLVKKKQEMQRIDQLNSILVRKLHEV